MAGSTRKTGRDYSGFDNMSTAELNEYLRKDSYNDNSDPDEVLYVMEVLAGREKQDDEFELPDVQKAWEEFQKYYNTEDNDGKPLRDFDDEAGGEAEADVTSIKSARKGIRRGIRALISTAAVICVILAGSVTAKAFGYDIWDAIAVWTKDTFSFETKAGGADPTPYVRNIPEELTELNQMMAEQGLSDKLIPCYIPSGYTMSDLQCSELSGTTTILCQLDNGSNSIILFYSIYLNGSSSFQFEKDAGAPEEYEIDGCSYYIMSNMDNYFISWLSGNTECAISGIPSHDEALKIVNSFN